MPPDGPIDDRIVAKVIEIIATHKKVPPASISLDSTFVALGVDSLDAIDLVFEFEEAFDITIPNDVAQQMLSVRQAVEALTTATTGRQAQAG